MERTKRTARAETIINLTFTAAIVVAILVAVGLRYGFWYDLNDDVMMKDILSGRYTGVPDGHNIQMLYPLSALIALFYRMQPNVDWYAVYLLVAQAACFFVVLFRALRFAQTIKGKALLTALFAAVFACALFPHMTFYQYTFTCAALSGAAAFLILTGERFANDLIAVLILLQAFLLRSEMMELTLPMVALAILFRWRRYVTEERVRVTGVVGTIKYLSLLIGLGVGMILSLIIHNVGYGSVEWRTFQRLFDNRTELYDFHEIPPYEGSEELYASLGLMRSEQELLRNYNYGLKKSIDADLIGAVAQYAAERDRASGKTAISAGDLIRRYSYRLRNFSLPVDWMEPQTDAPWNAIVLLLYALTFVVLMRTGAWWKLALLFACRSALWGYILARGRAPVRITHGLYFVEALILAGMALPSLRAEIDRTKQIITGVLAGLLLTVSVIFTPSAFRVTEAEFARRNEILTPFSALYQEMESHNDRFYFMDVYTWVPYSERFFMPIGPCPANHDIMGGWASKSPLYENKLQAFGYENMQNGLLEDNAYLIQSSDTETDWLISFYADNGERVRVTKEADVGEQFTIYSVRREK